MRDRHPARACSWRHVVTVAIGLGALVACDVTGVPGSGQAVAQTRTVEAFTEIEVRGAIQLNVAVGSDKAVSVSADDNLQPFIATRVDGTRLVIHPTTTVRPRAPLVVTVNLPRLDKIVALAATKVMITGIDGGALAVEAGGATTVSLRGRAESLTALLSGGARLDAQPMPVDRVEIDGTGAAQAEVTAERELSVDLKGACRVLFLGDPTVDKNVAEAAAVTRGKGSTPGAPRGPGGLGPGEAGPEPE